jgi:hypothetical protein
VSFDSTVQSFVLTPFLTATSGGRRVSSFNDGTPGALAFFWQAPTPPGASEGRAYLVSTQSPFAIELIQRAVGTSVDGKFGDLTRRAVIADANVHGVPFPPEEPALAPLMSYALNRAFFGGVGRVALPGSVVYPNIVTAQRANGNSTRVVIRDIATGQIVSMVPTVINGQQVSIPSTATQPPPSTPTPESRPPVTPQPTPTATTSYGRLDVTVRAPPASELPAGSRFTGFTPWTADGSNRLIEQQVRGEETHAVFDVAVPAGGASNVPVGGPFTIASADGAPHEARFQVVLPVRDGAVTTAVIQIHVSGSQVTAEVVSQSTVPATAAQPQGQPPVALPESRPESGLSTYGNNALGNVNVAQPPVVQQPPAPTGMSTAAKVGIGTAVAALVVGGVWTFRKQLGISKS